VTSVGPILAVPGIVDALRSTSAPVVGVSPIVGGAAVSGPAGALMRVRGLAVSPLGVADAYAPWLRRLLVDPRDGGCVPELARAGVEGHVADILMTSRELESALARRVLDAARERRAP
jgi:LPPG:FO 2-phospho-L-lactate transferase